MKVLKDVGNLLIALCFIATLSLPAVAGANEADLVLPSLRVPYTIFGYDIMGTGVLWGGIAVCLLGMAFGLFEFMRIKRLPAERSMLDVSSLIYETCKTYLLQQGKLLIILEAFIGGTIFIYFYALLDSGLGRVLVILAWSVLGILGSYAVAWFGMRINTYANSRTSFAALRGKAYPVMEIPLRSGMSIGVLLICVELVLMISILLFVPSENAGACFIGFAIGESLGASALRICGGIFTKIADIGADLMKIVFKIKEDDARNPGVIADCVGDNAGDSVGPTADGFETYGVTGVALITFIALAVGMVKGQDGTRMLAPGGELIQGKLLVWIFALSILMIVTSIFSYLFNSLISRALYGASTTFNFEAPLSHLLWLTSLFSIGVTYTASYFMIADMGAGLWWKLATIISCGTIAGALIPEFTKIFTSFRSKHVEEIVAASREGGASLTILSGIVAGNFSAFWKGFLIVGLMSIAYLTSSAGLYKFMIYPSIFAFGLVAFGCLSMGPVTIAVDSYGPVTDNAQSVFELSQIADRAGSAGEIEETFGFTPDFAHAKRMLEENDSAGNTFKATAKPVLIGTAVIGATTMIFSLILLIDLKLDLLDPMDLLGIISGGAVIFWFSGASMQAVTTGAHRAVKYIRTTINVDRLHAASLEDSKAVVRICTHYAQSGMLNIFGVLFCLTLAFACFSPTFFCSYLISIAVFGLFQATSLANAGGAWDNAKKIVEVELAQKHTPLHDATIVGDIVGDPFKDTTSVALNPIIKFTTLFGILAAEIAAEAGGVAFWVGIFLLILGLFFVWRSFYGMRIDRRITERNDLLDFGDLPSGATLRDPHLRRPRPS